MGVEIQQVPEYYQGYVKDITDEPLLDLLKRSKEEFTYLLNTFSDEKAMERYAPGKWSIKDLVQHIIDSERVFVYRAMRFARGDSEQLPGFEQDDYAANANADTRHISSLMGEFTSVRNSSISMFEAFSETELQRTGTASGVIFSVEVLGYLVSGHLLHHLKVIHEKYL